MFPPCTGGASQTPKVPLVMLSDDSRTVGETPVLSVGQIIEQSSIGTDILKAGLPTGMLVGDVTKFEPVLAPAKEVQQNQDSNVSSPSSSIIVQLKYGNVWVPIIPWVLIYMWETLEQHWPHLSLSAIS